MPSKKRNASEVGVEETSNSKIMRTQDSPERVEHRGRPRKSSDAPPKTTTETAANEAPRKRGRPRKAISPGAVTKKEPKVPGKRGRPRKQGSADAAPKKEPKVPGKRGRPRKETADAGAKDDTKTSAKATPTHTTLATRTGRPSKPALKDSKATSRKAANGKVSDQGQQFWLMKAEPESRVEKGVDVKFSIDDLKDATRPQEWDGVRNFAARNNLRAMKKGDLAFFYHSNCKIPGIVGTMEIVQEHSVDENAFDENHPYYDAKSSKDNPKWSLVHVEFRRKFDKPVTLPDLKKFTKPGSALENMELVKQSRLSVSKVTSAEWEFIMGLVDGDEKALEESEVEDASSDADEAVNEDDDDDDDDDDAAGEMSANDYDEDEDNDKADDDSRSDEDSEEPVNGFFGVNFE